MTGASLAASGNAWLNAMNCAVNLSSINISVNTSTGALNVTQGNADPSTNDHYLGLGQVLTVGYSEDHHTANLIYKVSGIYSGGGFTGANATVWHVGAGGSWSNSAGAPIETTVALTITSYGSE